MKRLVICALMLAVLLCAAWVTVGAQDFVESAVEKTADVSSEESVQESEDMKPAWQIFVEEKLLTTVASVLTSAFMVYAMVYPVIKGVEKASSLFGGAADDTKRVSEHGTAIKALFEDLFARMESQEKEQKGMQKLLVTALNAFALACTASEELVKSGAARALMEAVENYERKETE